MIYRFRSGKFVVPASAGAFRPKVRRTNSFNRSAQRAACGINRRVFRKTSRWECKGDNVCADTRAVGPAVKRVALKIGRRRMGRRPRGISLIEMLAVIAITGILISSVGVCLHGLYRADRRTRDAISGRSAISRVSVLFREDAHASTGARLQDRAPGVPAAMVFIQPEDRTIQYHFDEHRITRTVRVAGNVAHRDAFRLPDGGRAEWLVNENPTPIASAVIVHPPEPGVAGGTVWQEQIEAAVGLGNPGTQAEQEGDES